MRVEAICAPHITLCSKAIGTAIRAARAMQARRRRQDPPLRGRSSGEPKQTAETIRQAVTYSAKAVPNAAPATPRPIPGILIPSSGMES